MGCGWMAPPAVSPLASVFYLSDTRGLPQLRRPYSPAVRGVAAVATANGSDAEWSTLIGRGRARVGGKSCGVSRGRMRAQAAQRVWGNFYDKPFGGLELEGYWSIPEANVVLRHLGRVALFWDLDNKTPSQQHASYFAYRLRYLAHNLIWTPGMVSMRAYANARGKCNDLLQGLLSQGVAVRLVPQAPQAADKAIKEDMLRELCSGEVSVVCLVSDDRGYSKILESARTDYGVCTVVFRSADFPEDWADVWYSWNDVRTGAECFPFVSAPALSTIELITGVTLEDYGGTQWTYFH